MTHTQIHTQLTGGLDIDLQALDNVLTHHARVLGLVDNAHLRHQVVANQTRSSADDFANSPTNSAGSLTAPRPNTPPSNSIIQQPSRAN